MGTLDEIVESDLAVKLAAWAEKNWGFEDLTEGEIRCLWVLAHFLDDQQRRVYHLPEPAPKRLAGGYGFYVSIDSFGSFDGGGLAGLTMACFAAAVRSEITAETMHYTEDDGEWEHTLHWGPHPEDDWEYQTARLALRLSPRDPESDSIFDRHPKLNHIERMLESFQ